MKVFTKATALALTLGISGAANATKYSFTDPSTIFMEEGSSYIGLIKYSGLDSPVASASLSIELSDDMSPFPPFLDIPLETAQLTSVKGNLSSIGSPGSPLDSVEIDRNSGLITVTGSTISYQGDVSPPATPTVSKYFDTDVTSLLGGTSGMLEFTLDALDTIDNLPFILGGNPYIEDFNYNGAKLSIETSPVPLPAAIWLLGSGLLGLFGFSRGKALAT